MLPTLLNVPLLLRAVMGGRSNSMDSHDESKAVIIIGANW
jgi:hypothetical protein